MPLLHPHIRGKPGSQESNKARNLAQVTPAGSSPPSDFEKDSCTETSPASEAKEPLSCKPLQSVRSQLASKFCVRRTHTHTDTNTNTLFFNTARGVSVSSLSRSVSSFLPFAGKSSRGEPGPRPPLPHLFGGRGFGVYNGRVCKLRKV